MNHWSYLKKDLEGDFCCCKKTSRTRDSGTCIDKQNNTFNNSGSGSYSHLCISKVCHPTQIKKGEAVVEADTLK